VQTKTKLQRGASGGKRALHKFAENLLGARAERDYAASRIDMGDGRTLGPEDVLEGHWNRLVAQRRARDPRTVQVRVADNFSAAIMVMAPELAPLTELAEEVADVLPAVHPAPQFRRDLYAALEQTHRQHSAQRALGTRLEQPPDEERRAVWQALALLALGLLLWAGWRKARRRS